MVDVELWELISRLAVNGAGDLEAMLQNVSARWDTSSKNNVVGVVDRPPLLSKESWDEQMAANRRLEKSFKRRFIVSERVGWYQRRAGGCVSVGEIEGDFWGALCSIEGTSEFFSFFIFHFSCTDYI